MKVIYSIIAFLIIGILIIFIVQNWEIVDLKFLNYDLKIPVSFVSVAFYILGALSGTFIINILRRAAKGKSIE